MRPQPAPSTERLIRTVVTTWRNLVKELPPPTGFQALTPRGGVLRTAVWISQGQMTMTAPTANIPLKHCWKSSSPAILT